jgi:hypothetical protein
MNETRTKIGTWAGFLFILVWCLLPVVWIISLSFKGPEETGVGSPQFLPKEPTLQNYTDIFNNSDFKDSLINSFGIAAISTTLSVILATLAAYAIARLEFKGKRLVLSIALAIAMFPVVALVGPAVRVLPRDPLGDGAGRPGRWRDFVAGVSQGDRAAGGTGCLHRGDPDLLLCLERVRARALADVHHLVPHGPGAIVLLRRA